jgi:hypothetical protein
MKTLEDIQHDAELATAKGSNDHRGYSLRRRDH